MKLIYAYLDSYLSEPGTCNVALSISHVSQVRDISLDIEAQKNMLEFMLQSIME